MIDALDIKTRYSLGSLVFDSLLLEALLRLPESLRLFRFFSANSILPSDQMM